MKLYATMTSERASKAQGGNQFIETFYNIGTSDDSSVIAITALRVEGNKYTFIVYDASGEKVAQITRTKGEKQKGEGIT
jgi:hypothetical protein